MSNKERKPFDVVVVSAVEALRVGLRVEDDSQTSDVVRKLVRRSMCKRWYERQADLLGG
jgi:predicted secreted Zn-dependent protease